MELSHTDYIRMGQLVTITAVVSMILHNILLYGMRGRRLMLRLSRHMREQTRRSARYGIAVATLTFLASIALTCFFFERFFLSMPDTLRGDIFSFVKVFVYFLGGLLSMDLAFAGGMPLADFVWASLFRRRHLPTKDETV